MPHTGSCLCGTTKVTVASTHAAQIICHCTDCQLTSGSAHSTNILPLQTDVKIEGPNVKHFDSPSASGNTVTRVFCGNCGSALGHKSKAFGEAMAVQTGNLPDFRSIPIDTELFVKSRWTGIPAVPAAAQVNTMPGA